jgi:hypothetical protein
MNGIRDFKLLGGLWFNGLECFEYEKNVTPLPDLNEIEDCIGYQPAESVRMYLKDASEVKLCLKQKKQVWFDLNGKQSIMIPSPLFVDDEDVSVDLSDRHGYLEGEENATWMILFPKESEPIEESGSNEAMIERLEASFTGLRYYEISKTVL